MVFDEFWKRGGADFFFAFEEEGDVAGEFVIGVVVLKGTDGFEYERDLAFVVAGAAGVDVAIADGGFEGRGVPFIVGC